MSASDSGHPKAQSPDDLFRFFAERANAGDVEGLVDLYEPDGVVMFKPGQPSVGADAIRQGVIGMLAGMSTFSADGQQPSIVVGDIALTSAQLGPDMVTAEVARRQPDGTWKWVLDNPFFVSPES
jgi:ketosteroid isomerase-like protein